MKPNLTTSALCFKVMVDPLRCKTAFRPRSRRQAFSDGNKYLQRQEARTSDQLLQDDVCGKDAEKCHEVNAGDIVAIPKLQSTSVATRWARAGGAPYQYGISALSTAWRSCQDEATR